MRDLADSLAQHPWHLAWLSMLTGILLWEVVRRLKFKKPC